MFFNQPQFPKIFFHQVCAVPGVNPCRSVKSTINTLINASAGRHIAVPLHLEVKKENNIPVYDICTIDRQAHKDLLVDRFEDYLKQHYGHLNALCSELPGKTAGMTIAETAYEINFQDNSSLNRFFKKYVGTMPDAFRKKFMK